MKLDILNGTCKKCGEPCHEKQAFCKKCKPIRVVISTLIIVGTLIFAIMANMFVPVLIPFDSLYETNLSEAMFVDYLLLFLYFLPLIIAAVKIRSYFKPPQSDENRESTLAEAVTGVKDEDAKNHQKWDSLK